MILRLATFAMGTRFELVLIGADEVHLRSAGEEAVFEIEECDRRLSLFRRDSLLGHLNRVGAAAWVRVDTDTFALFRVCAEVHRRSRGAFDPTVAPLMEALGFRDAAPGDVAAARERVAWDAVELDPERHAVRFARPGIALDLGAIGKGHALDLAARALADAGVERALLHGGSSAAVALGPPPGAKGWRIAVAEGPRAPVATLAHAAFAVSAPEGRTALVDDGERIGHVLDPRTGRSARGVARAAVIAPDATSADAWSTALLVAGRELDVPAELETLFAEDGETPTRWHHTPPASGTPIRFTLLANAREESA